MTIQHKQTGSKGIFFITEEDEIVAELTYSMSHDGQMIIEHTEVDEEQRGGDLGYGLVQQSVNYARTHFFKIIPLCSFAKAVLDKKPEFRDIIG